MRRAGRIARSPGLGATRGAAAPWNCRLAHRLDPVVRIAETRNDACRPPARIADADVSGSWSPARYAGLDPAVLRFS